MNQDYPRSERVGDTIHKELSTIIQQQLRDPRIDMVNINSVDLSKDLSMARVFVTFINTDDLESCQQQIKILNKASGFLRTQLARCTSLRGTPKLIFIFDSSVIQGQQLSSLIEEALHQDQSNQATNSLLDEQTSINTDDPSRKSEPAD